MHHGDRALVVIGKAADRADPCWYKIHVTTKNVACWPTSRIPSLSSHKRATAANRHRLQNPTLPCSPCSTRCSLTLTFSPSSCDEKQSAKLR